MQVEIIPAVALHIEQIAKNTREPDRDELWAMSLCKPEDAMRLGLAKKPGSGARGHNKPTQPSQPGQSGQSSPVDPTEADDDELLTEFRNDMRVFTGADDDTLIRCSTETLTKHLAEVEAYTIRIREILSRRKTIAQRGVKPAARAASAPKRIDL